MTSNPALMFLWRYMNLCSLGAMGLIPFHIWSQPFRYISFWDFAQPHKTMTLIQQKNTTNTALKPTEMTMCSYMSLYFVLSLGYRNRGSVTRIMVIVVLCLFWHSDSKVDVLFYCITLNTSEWERESSPVIINSFLLLTKKLHLVCGRVSGLDVGLHL